ncbi:hypothetical protein [Pseudomonas aeruginosa]|uniref:hypothetical protein n=1 Tax=Pseudomonas aeruginosa TaxID=287 RepID=UPI0003D31B20|nr:hypothetical protein [Pseudomonas aeruginosa]ANA73641.1 hypothetical protein A6R75_27035 [Pseudomonas aeruginosa]ETD47266.1 hypothetical protein X778_26355 [Pseudomonas aeruginosa VRFPA07]KSQ07337.1 hypothetical protein APB22_00010 [Pseudomonas aeruginosa]MDG3690085.1 hypothetical protein [Pseudomonas aeruginosa]MDG3958939.1 hypothetical protein [Pseudomonas aeruginosa]
MRKHTPGPWEYSPVRGSIALLHIYCADNKGPFHVERSDAETDANAKLIAAAPELLEALQHIEEYWNRDSNEQAMTDALWHIIETAQAAIAKATA